MYKGSREGKISFGYDLKHSEIVVITKSRKPPPLNIQRASLSIVRASYQQPQMKRLRRLTRSFMTSRQLPLLKIVMASPRKVRAILPLLSIERVSSTSSSRIDRTNQQLLPPDMGSASLRGRRASYRPLLLN